LFDILELENVKFVHLIVGSKFYVIIVVTREGNSFCCYIAHVCLEI